MRGGTEDNAGADNVNPLSLVPPPVRGVYLLSLHGGAPQQLGEGSQVALSPRGNAVAWVKDGALMIVDTRRRARRDTRRQNRKSLSIRGQAQNPVWSPDGTRIAFSNPRDGNHSYIVIYTPAAHRYVLCHARLFDR